MNIIAKVFFLSILAIILISAAKTEAGVLESLDQELTSLAQQASTFMVTVEAHNSALNNVFVGTGVLIDKAGHILTTTSIVGDSDAVKVAFSDGDEYVARLVGSDRHTGMALLKIEPVDRNLPKFGDPNSLKAGSWIVIIGNSYDMPNSVNFGVFSGLTDDGFLQLSAQSGPGSSGSAIFNTKGELVGLLVAQAKETIAVQPADVDFVKVKANSYNESPTQNLANKGIEIPSGGISLAAPIDKLSRVADQLMVYGEVEHGFLGIKQKRLSEKQSQQMKIDGGVQVTAVSKNSPAERAGIVVGDIITKFDEKKVKGSGHLYGMVRSYLPDEKVKLNIIRDNAEVAVTVALGKTNDDGYFGFRQNSDPATRPGLLSAAEPSDKLAKAKKQLPGLDSKPGRAELKPEIAELNARIQELELNLKELSAKISELNKKLEK